MQRPMLAAVTLGLFLLLSALPGAETGSWAVAVGLSCLLLWRRSRELAVPRALVHLLLFPCLLLCLSLHGIYTHPLPDFLKDCWYFTLPIVYLTLGYLLFERIGGWQRFLQPFLIAGLLVAAYLLLHAAVNRRELAGAATVDAYRAVTGNGSFAPLAPMLLLLFTRRAGLAESGLARWKAVRVTVYALGTASALVTLSRTHILALLAGMACVIQYRRALRQLLHGVPGLLVLLAALGLGVYGVAHSSAHASGGPLDLFVAKVLHSSSEVSVRPYETFAEINNNWRGYEAYRASKTFAGYSMADKLFGGGGGALVDLRFAMQLGPAGQSNGANLLRYIPILHNGYMYLLVKTGVCGLGLFALFLLQLLRMSRQANRRREPEARVAGLALLWTAIVIASTQGVISGIYNKGELIPILLLTGAAAASCPQRQRAMEGRVAGVGWEACS